MQGQSQYVLEEDCVVWVMTAETIYALADELHSPHYSI